MFTRTISAVLMLLLLIGPALADAAQGASGTQGGAQRGRAATPPPGARAGGRAQTAPPVQPSPGAGPVILFETVKGNFEVETYPKEAPKTVEHFLTLVRRNFYNGLRVHRQINGFVVQFGDPQTRDMTKRDMWGTGGSGKQIGVAEMNPKRPHKVGAVAAAHAGDPRFADSQLYVALTPQPQLNSNFTVWGQVLNGMDVVQKLRVNDIIRRASVKK